MNSKAYLGKQISALKKRLESEKNSLYIQNLKRAIGKFQEELDLLLFCEKCGWCCQAGYSIETTWVDAIRCPEIREKGVEIRKGYRISKKRDGFAHSTCVFFDKDRGCTIYAKRPDVCRTFAASKKNPQCILNEDRKKYGQLKSAEI